jgi:hypothetical protein
MNADPEARAAAGLLDRVRLFVRDYRHVFIVFAASRVLVFATILFSQLVMVRAEFWHSDGLLPILMNWDGERWYLDIVRHGYQFDRANLSNIAFFPFYPLLVKALSFIIHDVRIAGVLTANACFLAAGLFLHKLVRVEFENRRAADAAVTFLMFSPVSFFFSSTYTESTFIMLALLATLAALQRRWLIACLAGMCLTATRNVGIWISVLLFIEYLRQALSGGFSLRRLFHPRGLLLGLVPLGLGSFMLFCYVNFDDPMAFAHAGERWGRRLVTPVQSWATLLSGPHGVDAARDPFHRLIAVSGLLAAALLCLAGLAFRIRASYLVWAALLIATYLCSNSLEAMARYLSVIFPFFIVLGLLASRFPRTYEPLLAASIGVLTLLTMLQANGYWIT